MLLSPTGETQFIGLYAPEHSKSSDSGQHGFFLTHAIPMLCGLSLWLSISNGDPILSCPTAISPVQRPGRAPSSQGDLQQQPQVPPTEHCITA